MHVSLTAHEIFLWFGAVFGVDLHNARYQLRDVGGVSSGHTILTSDTGKLYQLDLLFSVFVLQM